MTGPQLPAESGETHEPSVQSEMGQPGQDQEKTAAEEERQERQDTGETPRSLLTSDEQGSAPTT